MSKEVSKEMFSKHNTFRKLKKPEKGSRRYMLHKQAKKTLHIGNPKVAVKLPHGEDLNEWMAANSTLFLAFPLPWTPRPPPAPVLMLFAAIDFYNQISVIYGTVSDFCTDRKCPKMNAGPKSAVGFPYPLPLPSGSSTCGPTASKSRAQSLSRRLNTLTI